MSENDPERRKRKSDARQSGMVATVALLVLLALTVVFVLAGG